MGHGHWHRNSCLLIAGILLGIVFGLIEAFLWLNGLIPTIRAIIPYATADALLIFGLTAIIATILAVAQATAGSRENGLIFHGFSDYVGVIMISSTIFLLFVQVFVGTALTFALKAVLAFIGALSFWVMLMSFVAFILSIARRR